ncbi:MAG: histidine phosphatase family protein [Hyphomicrobium sp.]
MLNDLIGLLKRLIFGTQRTEPGVSPFASGQGPARVLIMRHAEKTGDPLDPHLSLEGQRRAERLVTYVPQTFGTPDFLIAARTSKKSQRPYDTLAPLAHALGLNIKEKFDDEDVDALVEHLGENQKYGGKFAVISWRHSDIPALIAALGGPRGSYPETWNSSVYNVIFEVSFRDGAPPRVRQITEPF